MSAASQKIECHIICGPTHVHLTTIQFPRSITYTQILSILSKSSSICVLEKISQNENGKLSEPTRALPKDELVIESLNLDDEDLGVTNVNGCLCLPSICL